MKSKKGLVATKHVLLRHTLFRAISGLAAGIIMTPFLMLIGVIMGVSYIEIASLSLKRNIIAA